MAAPTTTASPPHASPSSPPFSPSSPSSSPSCFFPSRSSTANNANHLPPPLYTDHPLPLLPTPLHTTGATDAFTLEASHMALSHNVLIRGFNSIYQTAPRLFSAADTEPAPLAALSPSQRAACRADFVAYCRAWARLVQEHHRVEEEGIFPAVERIVGERDVLGRETTEHAAIHEGIESIHAYLNSLSSAEALSPTTLLSILDSLSGPLQSHLASEPLALAALSRFAPAFAAAGTTLVDVALAEGKKAMASLDFVLNVLPCFMLNMEFEEFEGGYWAGRWPDIKGVGRWAVFHVVPLWHSKRWRFASCDAQGRRKRLAV